MFKLVVLCAFVAAVVGEPEPEPQLLLPGILPYSGEYSTIVSPGSTSISSQSSSVIHPSPAYTTYAGLPYAHVLKKRSPQFLAPVYNSVLPSYNYYPNLATPYISTAPLVQSSLYGSPALPVAAHLIKKRSADPQFITPFNNVSPLLTPSTYITSSPAIAPVLSTSYLQTPYYSNDISLINTHLIKKRSADPQYISPYYNVSPFYPTTTVLKSDLSPIAPVAPISPFIASNPYVYSTFIKK